MSELYDPLKPLDIQLTGIDYERALIPEGMIKLQVVSAVAEPNKNKDNTNIHITSTLVNPVPTTKEGVVAQPGERNFQTWDNVYATPKQQEKGIDPLASICQIFDALLGTDDSNRPNLSQDTLNQLAGKQFMGLVRHEDDPQYGKQDRLVRYLPLVEEG